MTTFIALLWSLTLFAATSQIIETPHFKEICNYTNEETLVILDIDDTLLVPKQTLGTDVWFCYQLEKNSAAPNPLDKTLSQWEAIRHLSDMQIVEEGSDKIVSDLQNKNIRVMGLTTQGLALATRTHNQLKENNINLSKSAPSQEDHYFLNGHGVLYRKGILFTAGSPKGPALEKLLKEMNYHPKKILFINDKKSHLLDVASSMEKLNIPFIGLRYTYSDPRVASFNPKIAEIQFHKSNFGHILSDTEAKLYLEAPQ